MTDTVNTGQANSWLKLYTDNYYGRTPEAVELSKVLSTNYNGQKYVPWATMERFLYMQDPLANLYVSFDGDGPVGTQKWTIEQVNKNAGAVIETSSPFYSHMVRVTLTFMGKYFEEYYPVQDNKYGAPKIIDQNLVNRALQRAKAKIIARATGLGLALYEQLDLQFEKEAS